MSAGGRYAAVFIGAAPRIVDLPQRRRCEDRHIDVRLRTRVTTSDRPEHVCERDFPELLQRGLEQLHGVRAHLRVLPRRILHRYRAVRSV